VHIARLHAHSMRRAEEMIIAVDVLIRCIAGVFQRTWLVQAATANRSSTQPIFMWTRHRQATARQ